MQPVGADNDVEIARRTVLERDANALVALLDGGDTVAEDRLNLIAEPAEYRGGEFAARNAHVAPVRDSAE